MGAPEGLTIKAADDQIPPSVAECIDLASEHESQNSEVSGDSDEYDDDRDVGSPGFGLDLDIEDPNGTRNNVSSSQGGFVARQIEPELTHGSALIISDDEEQDSLHVPGPVVPRPLAPPQPEPKAHPARVARRRGERGVPRLPRGNAPSSKWNLSSVWVGNLSFVERTDQSATGTVFSFYVVTPGKFGLFSNNDDAMSYDL